jgi:hypothetical protein
MKASLHCSKKKIPYQHRSWNYSLSSTFIALLSRPRADISGENGLTCMRARPAGQASDVAQGWLNPQTYWRESAALLMQWAIPSVSF